MPATVLRNEYYWEADRLVCRTNRRSTIFSRWRLAGQDAELVVAIEDLRDSKKFTQGGAASPVRVAHAILRENRLSADQNAEDIGLNIPEPLVSRAASVVEAAVREVTRQYQRLAAEERRTGAVSYELNKNETIELDGWELTITLQGFSSQTKEPLTGADVGLVVDVRQGDKQVSKGALIQAKEVDSMPDEPLTLDRLKGQMEGMLKRTKDAYAMIYTPNGVFVFQGRESHVMTDLSAIVGDIARCRRGDRRPEVLAEAVEEEYTVELLFQNVAIPHSTEAIAIV